MYIVIKAFYDLTDPVKVKVVKGGVLPLAYRLYNVGDVYPAIGAPIPSQERVEELATDKNKQNVPLIGWCEPEKEAEKEAAESPVEPPKETTEETPAKTEKAPAKRRTARKRTSKSTSDKTGTAKKRTSRKKADANDGTGNS